MRLVLKGCPRCAGDVLLTPPIHISQYQDHQDCLGCGWTGPTKAAEPITYGWSPPSYQSSINTYNLTKTNEAKQNERRKEERRRA